jgi:hypothetical protein
MFRQLAAALLIGGCAWALAGPAFGQEPFRYKTNPEGLGLKSEETSKRSPWREFVSKDGGFRVEFPGTPIASDAEVATPFGTAKIHLQSVPAIKVVYGAHYLDYPQSTKKLSAQKLIDAARDEAKAGFGGKILEENSLARNDVEGREVMFDVPTLQAVCRVQYFVRGGRLYQVAATGPRDMVTTNFSQRFFKSWALVEDR